MCKKYIIGYICKMCIDGKIFERIFFLLMVEMSWILDKLFIYLNIILEVGEEIKVFLIYFCV